MFQRAGKLLPHKCTYIFLQDAAWKGQFLPDPLSDGFKPQSMSSGIALIIVSTHPKVIVSEENCWIWNQQNPCKCRTCKKVSGKHQLRDENCAISACIRVTKSGQKKEIMDKVCDFFLRKKFHPSCCFFTEKVHVVGPFAGMWASIKCPKPPGVHNTTCYDSVRQ